MEMICYAVIFLIRADTGVCPYNTGVCPYNTGVCPYSTGVCPYRKKLS